MSTTLTSGATPTSARGHGLNWSNVVLRRGLKALVIALMAFTVWRYAWLSDDALITLRTALNWAHGNGPVFNPGERVAGYTHPLWFLVLTAAGAVSDSWIYGTLYLAICLSVIAIAVVVGRTRNPWQFVTVSATLLLSTAFVDWSTSGLETPLAAVILAGLFLAMQGSRRALVAGVLVGLLLLCRLDYIILLAPWLGWLLFQHRRDRGFLVRLAGGLSIPILVWAVPTYVYYGFVLPATFAAKTNVQLPPTVLVGRGLEYLWNSLAYDTALAVFLVGSVVIAALTRDRTFSVWVAGAGLYLGYVIWVGGDFMLGRFLYIPALALMLALTSTRIDAGPGRRMLVVLPVATVILGLPGSLLVSSGPKALESAPDAPMLDERLWWNQFGRSLDPLGTVSGEPAPYPTTLADLDRSARAWPEEVPVGTLPADRVWAGCGSMAAVAFIRPADFAVDQCGLTDRFLGAQPFVLPSPDAAWKAGHLERPLPDGYLEAIRYNDPSRVRDPQLAAELQQLWERIRPN